MIPTFVLWRETSRWRKTRQRLSMVKGVRMVGGAIWLLPCVIYIFRVEYPDPDDLESYLERFDGWKLSSFGGIGGAWNHALCQ
jgi:hypothetical protein